MALSDVEICNMALAHVGAAMITSLDDPIKEAKLCKLFYAHDRDRTLDEREWTFAVKRAKLIELADPPAWGYGHQFQLPPDCGSVRYAGYAGQPQEAEDMDYRIEGDRLLTDYDTVYIRYLAEITDPSIIPSSVIQVIVLRLAASLAIPITNSRSLHADLSQKAEFALREAAAEDGIQGKRERIRSNRLINVRGYGVY